MSGQWGQLERRLAPQGERVAPLYGVVESQNVREKTSKGSWPNARGEKLPNRGE